MISNSVKNAGREDRLKLSFSAMENVGNTSWLISMCFLYPTSISLSMKHPIFSVSPLSIRKTGVSSIPWGARFCFAHGVERGWVGLTLSPVLVFIDSLSSLSFVGNLSQSSSGRQNLSKLGMRNSKSRKTARELQGKCLKRLFITLSLFFVNCKFSVGNIYGNAEFVRVLLLLMYIENF